LIGSGGVTYVGQQNSNQINEIKLTHRSPRRVFDWRERNRPTQQLNFPGCIARLDLFVQPERLNVKMIDDPCCTDAPNASCAYKKSERDKNRRAKT
jgi:hypothetical protein